MNQAIVVGGGISGIAAAAQLVQHGVPTTLLECEPSLGGRIGTRKTEAGEVDLGGRNFSVNDRHLVKLLESFGLGELQDYRINSVSVGTRRQFDMRSGGSLMTRVRRLVGNATCANPFDLFRLQKVVAGARKDPVGSVVGGPYWADLAQRTADPSAAAFFGQAVADSVLRPWTLRMMAAEPEEVYLGNLGPLLGRTPGPLKRVGGGMGAFLRAAMKRHDVRLGHSVRSIVVHDGRVKAVEGTRSDGSTFRELAEIVVVATPAPIAATLLPFQGDLVRILQDVAYRPVATVVAEYADVAFPRGVSGLFLPRGHAVSHIAKYDETHRVRFSYAGVAARRAIGNHCIEGLLEIGEKTFAMFGGRLGPRHSFEGNVWRPGLCGQTWMHHQTLDALMRGCRSIRGLALTGDYFRGNSLEACTAAAQENVEALLQDLGEVGATSPSPIHPPRVARGVATAAATTAL